MTEINRSQSDREFFQREVTRRILLRDAAGGAIGLTAAGWLLGCGGDSTSTSATSASTGEVGGTLNVLCWEGYTDPSFTKSFERENGVKINSTFIGSNDELVAKLRGAPDQYDLVSPSSDTTNLLIDNDQVQPIDLNSVPNAETTFEFFRAAPNVNVDGSLYGVPMCWGFIPLIYDEDVFSKAPTSWEELWSPDYRDQVSMWQDISMLWTTGLLLGYDNVYEMDDAQLEAVKNKLIEQKPNIRKYWTTAGELTNLFANNEIVTGMSFGGLTVTQLRAQGRNVSEVIPDEGATSWFDSWMITKGSQNTATALAFLDHLNTPESQKKIAAATGYGIANENAVDLVPKEYRQVYHLDDPDFIAGLDYWKAVPDRQKYLDVLNAVVAA
jgi:putative spermidine/putrescine transport system substrate-binding protein/spermidine/putrescine transport system substrate-binding protein